MKRLLSLLMATLVLTGVARWAHADEDDKTQLEFVHRLRERHMSSLALEYLERLKTIGSPALKKLIPVEIARTKIGAARELDAEQRKKLFEEARQTLEAFAKANEGSSEAAQARLEKARIASYEAQALLSIAQRQEERANILSFAHQAEEKYKQAAKELDNAFKSLPPQDQVMVKFEKAKNIWEQAQTILDRSKQVESNRRAKLLEESRLALEAIEKEAGKDEKSEALHLARAWLFKLYKSENLDSAITKVYLKKVLNADGPQAAVAQRLVQSHIIQGLAKDPDVKETGLARIHLIEDEAQKWLRINRNYRSTPEGYAVRFALANAYLAESLEISKDKKKQATAAKIKKLALKEFTELSTAENDFQEEATIKLTMLSMERIGKQPIENLISADDCFLKARYELSKMQEVIAQQAKTPEKDVEKNNALKKQREEHETNSVLALRRTISLAEKSPSLKDRFKKIGEARYYLAYVYLLLNLPQEVIKIGEQVAQEDLPKQTKFSPLTANYALEAYTRLMNNEQEAANARKNLMRFADYLVKNRQAAWQGEPVLQLALFHHAMACLREKSDVRELDPAEKYRQEIKLMKDAIDLFGKLSPEFRGYDYAQCQKAYAAMLAMKHIDKNTERDPKKFTKDNNPQVRAKDRAAFQDIFFKTMKALKPVGPKTDPGTVQLYFSVQIEQGNMVFGSAATAMQQENWGEATRKYTELGTITSRLKQEFALAGNKLDGGIRDSFGQAITALDNRVRLGLGTLDYRANQYPLVLSPPITGQVVAEIKRRGQKEKEIIVHDDRVICGLLGLALRANVQVGKVPDAMEVLDLLRRTRGDKGAIDIASEELETLIRELKIQMRELKNDKNKFEAAVKRFTLFLDELAKVKGKGASAADQLFLGNFYSSLNNYKEAAKYFEKVPRPKAVDEKIKLDKLDKKVVKELQQYWMMRVLYGRTLRLDGQLPEAKKTLEEAATHPLSAAKFLAQKELIHLEEDARRFGNAIVGWQKFLTNKQLTDGLSDKNKTVAEQRRLKELYFEGYYHLIYSYFMYGKNYKKTDKKADKKDFYIQKATDNIQRLEASSNRDGWEIAGPRILELIAGEPLLYNNPNMAEILRKYTKKTLK